MQDHEFYEQLCSLSPTGDLTEQEFGRLQEHLHICAACREAYRAYHSIVLDGIPVMASAKPALDVRWLLAQSGLKQKLLQRARVAGIPTDRLHSRWQTMWAPVAFAVAVVVAGCIGYALRPVRMVPQPPRIVVRENSQELQALSNRIADLQRQLADRQGGVPGPAAQNTNSSRERELAAGLALLRETYEAALLSRRRLDESVSALSRQADQLRAESQTARGEVESLRRTLAETQASLAAADRALEPLRASRAADAAMIAGQRTRIDELAASLREQTETVQQERQLLAAGKDIRDLMGARDLHIIDVIDDGPPGKRRAIPGRVFYTQGKSLIFYAFDLENRARPETVAFQVWGKKEGKTQPARSLGIFYQDDARQKRWFMKSEDPVVLAGIDQVFVTVERPGGNSQPTGKRLLFAAIPQQPNHP